jgi:hypothetical protein
LREEWVIGCAPRELIRPLFLVLAGIPLMYLYLATAFSTIGMIAWSAGYRSYKQ